MVEAMTAVWALSEANGSDLLVLLAIANEYNHNYGAAWPSLNRIADMARCSVRQVQMSVKRAVERGELEVIQKAHRVAKGESRYTYRFLLPIQTRRTTGAKSAGVKKRQAKISVPTGEDIDKDTTLVPLRDPLRTDLDHPYTGQVYAGGHVPKPKKEKPSKHDPHVFCGDWFCVTSEKHEAFAKRWVLAGGSVEEFAGVDWYSERDHELQDIKITDHPALWLEKQFSASLKSEFGE